MQVVNGFWDMLYQYMGNNILYIFVIVSWILFVYQLKKSEIKTVLLAVLILIIAVFNPWSYKMLIELTGQYKTYYRFLWIIPCEIAASYFLYGCLQHMKVLKYRLMLVCGICLGLLCINTSRENWKLPENSYQLPYDVLEVADALKELRTESKQEKVTIIADTNICNVIRQYDANICLPFSAYDFADAHEKKRDIPYLMCMLMDNQDNIDAEAIGKILTENHIDYLVVHINNDISLSYMQRLHWQIVATTTAYHILQYQEPVFTTAPLSAAGLGTEEVDVVIPGLTAEYHFLCLVDLHIITENNEISQAELETVLTRRQWSSVSEGVTSAEYWGSLPELLDSCNADGKLLGGDIIDFCSTSNAECLKQGLDRLVTPYLYVRADHDLNPYWCEGIEKEQCNTLHSEMDGNWISYRPNPLSRLEVIS